MNSMRMICSVAIATLLVVTSEPVFGHGVVIGRDSTGQLRVLIVVPMPAPLQPSPYPGITGFADAEPGITAAEIDYPADDVFQLDPSCYIQFILVGMDPGLQIVTDHVWVPGEMFDFANPPFDDHLVFNIPKGKIGSIYSLQFRVVDLNGIYSDSTIYTLQFTPVAELCSCRGDMDADAALSGADVQVFIGCMLETPVGESPDTECACADMDADGALDEVDVDMFVERLLGPGTCP